MLLIYIVGLIFNFGLYVALYEDDFDKLSTMITCAIFWPIVLPFFLGYLAGTLAKLIK